MASSSSTASTLPNTPTPPPVSATRVVVLHPVTATGTPAPGFRVVVDTQAGTVDCGREIGATASPFAIGANVLECSPSAAAAYACWRAASAATVLCLRDPWQAVLAQLSTTGPVTPISQVSTPRPIGVELADGTHCLPHAGGTGARLNSHPDWAVLYRCGAAGALWGGPTGTGFNQASAAWTGQLAPETADGNATVRSVSVRAAYFVGGSSE